MIRQPSIGQWPRTRPFLARRRSVGIDKIPLSGIEALPSILIGTIRQFLDDPVPNQAQFTKRPYGSHLFNESFLILLQVRGAIGREPGLLFLVLL
jgi:hypothetical protein